MKQCIKCQIFKNESNFSNNRKYVDGLSCWCRLCWKLYKKNYRINNIQKSKCYINNRRAQRIQWFRKLKSNKPCTDCGHIYEPCCMDFDHLPGRDKIKNISRMVLDNTPKDNILKEMDKCQLVCLLCHNRRTYFRFSKNKKYKFNRRRNIAIINNFKNKPCAMCNVKYEHYNMQMDHIDPVTKLYDVCQLKGYKVETLMIELKKCQVLCALCHRIKSIAEQKIGKYLIKN